MAIAERINVNAALELQLSDTSDIFTLKATKQEHKYGTGCFLCVARMVYRDS